MQKLKEKKRCNLLQNSGCCRFFPGMMYLYCTITVQCKMYTYLLLRYTDLLGQLTMIFNPSLLLWVVSVLADTLVSITAKKLSTSWNNFILGLSTAHGIFLRRRHPHNFPCSCFDTRCLFLFLFISLFLFSLSLSLCWTLTQINKTLGPGWTLSCQNIPGIRGSQTASQEDAAGKERINYLNGEKGGQTFRTEKTGINREKPGLDAQPLVTWP